MRTELAPASTGGSDRGRPRGLPAARRWTVLLLLGGLASCVAPDGGTGSGPAGGPAGAAAGGLVDGGRREPLPPVSAPIVRDATDRDADDAQPGDESGESQAGVGTSADPGSSGGGQEPPEDAPPPPVPPHMQPNGDPEPESPSGQP